MVWLLLDVGFFTEQVKERTQKEFILNILLFIFVSILNLYNKFFFFYFYLSLSENNMKFYFLRLFEFFCFPPLFPLRKKIKVISGFEIKIMKKEKHTSIWIFEEDLDFQSFEFLIFFSNNVNKVLFATLQYNF